MTPTLTAEQAMSLQESGGSPVPVIDAQSKKLYYLISEEQLRGLHALVADGDFDPEELFGLAVEAAGRAGWDAPEMDIYDHHAHQR
jgi:hypothetical protein